MKTNERNYSVFYAYGDEVNDQYLTKEDAMSLAKELEENGYEVIVAKLVNDEWVKVYKSMKCPYCGSENYEWMGDVAWADDEKPYCCHDCDGWFGEDNNKKDEK